MSSVSDYMKLNFVALCTVTFAEVVKAHGKSRIVARDIGSSPTLAINISGKWSSTIFPKKGVLPLFAPICSKDAQTRNSSNRALSRAEQHL